MAHWNGSSFVSDLVNAGTANTSAYDPSKIHLASAQELLTYTRKLPKMYVRREKQAIHTLRKPLRVTAVSLLCFLALVPGVRANLVQNGNFASVTYSGTLPLTTVYGQFGTGTGSTLAVANWTTSGYNFLYAPNTADVGTTAGANAGSPNEAPGQYNASNGYGSTYMWGSNNGGTVTLPSTDPAGGNFIAADGAYEVGAISQTITGLKVGDMYRLTFYWAAAQQQGYTTATTEAWQVSLGSQTFSTGTYSLPAKGFSGWMQQVFVYTATNATETLSFLAIGTPNGQPPFVLLGGVDLTVVPEFSNWMVFAGFGVACTVFEVRRRRRRAEVTTGD
jgi:hypothetical protein